MKKMKMICMAALIMAVGTANAAAPFGGDEDVKYAKNLWTSMVNESYAGKDAIKSRPYTGQHPHGAILDTIEGPINIDGRLYNIIIKRNYGGPGVSRDTVANDPAKYLKAVTVMLKRPGYDPETNDWFWVKYKADGSIDTNPAGMKLAGKVAKGKPKGCIACHTAAPGGDMMFLHD
ncbi:MAG: cytochrome P460 family protein [Gammaproteobacteria bacterium]